MIGNLDHAQFRGERTEWWHSPRAGAPLLFLFHAPGDSLGSWMAQAAYFREKYEIICPIARRSSLDSNLLDMLAILKAVACRDERRVYAVGHYAGAELAAHFMPLLAT